MVRQKSRHRRLTLAFIAVFVSVIAVAVTPAPAHAGMTGMQKCQAHQAPTKSVPMSQGGNIPATNYPDGSNPPNGFNPGDALHLVVYNTWTKDTMVGISWWGEWYTIDGKFEDATSGYPFPGFAKYADYFRMNNNPGGWVASGTDPNPWNPHLMSELSTTTCWATPNLPVRMVIQINDDNVGDNQGRWQYTLQIWHND
jgi:hypothetical protein